MNRTETNAVIATINAAYPHSVKGMSDAERVAQARLWEKMLAKESAEDVAHALERHIRKEKFPPTIAEILAATTLLKRGRMAKATLKAAGFMEIEGCNYGGKHD